MISCRGLTIRSGDDDLAGVATGCSAAHGKPASSRAIATAIFGVGLCSAAICGTADTIAVVPYRQSRSRALAALASPGERHTDARAVLVMARDLQESADQCVPGARAAATSMLLPPLAPNRDADAGLVTGIGIELYRQSCTPTSFADHGQYVFTTSTK